MKFEFKEARWGVSVHLTPETPKEVAQLLRFAKNAKAEKPNINFSFSSDEPSCYIYMNKIHESKQSNYIKPTGGKTN